MPSGVIELKDEEEKSYFESITATCTEKIVHDTFGAWILDPPVEDVELKCIPIGFCDVQRGKHPIPVDDGDKKVKFAPFNDFLVEPLTKFGQVEIGGHIFAYCKGQGI